MIPRQGPPGMGGRSSFAFPRKSLFSTGRGKPVIFPDGAVHPGEQVPICHIPR